MYYFVFIVSLFSFSFLGQQNIFVRNKHSLNLVVVGLQQTYANKGLFEFERFDRCVMDQFRSVYNKTCCDVGLQKASILRNFVRVHHSVRAAEKP